MLAIGCTPGAPAGNPAAPAATSSTSKNANGAPPTAMPAATDGMATFEVKAHGGGRELEIEGTIPGGAGSRVSVDGNATAGVRDPSAWVDGHWEALRRAPDGDDLLLPACRPAPCRVRYRFALGDVARASDDAELAQERSGAFVAPSTTWLLLPTSDSVPAHRFHVQMDTGTFATGADDTETAGTFVQTATDLAVPFSVFGAFRATRFESSRAKVDVVIAPGQLAIDDRTLVDLVRRTIVRIADYDGFFPDPHVLVVLMPAGAHDENGVTLGGGGASMMLHVPRNADEKAIEHAWVLTHELLHVAFPTVGPPHRWMEEGLSTYLEPVVRARAGVVDPKDFWSDLVNGLPQGEPKSGDEGLENTHGWAATYWGGALFWFEVDLGIRRRTGGKRSLRDALREIANEGGRVGQHWPIERVLTIGDRGAGVPVLQETYEAMGLKAETVDLAATWKSLGVESAPGRTPGVAFDPKAPEAGFCRQIPRGEP